MRPRPPLPPGPYLVLGLARSGVAAALALRERGEEAIGVDAGSPAGLEALERAGVELRLGGGLAAGEGAGGALGMDVGRLLDRVGAVVKSPGVPGDVPVLAAARARGLPVLGELELAWRLLENELIAVTGTNGKTTTVELIGHVHREAGLPVVVAGNVGSALSGLVGRIEREGTVVCETSSFQLEDTVAFAPQAGVVLNLTPDHLDRHGTMEAYRDAKLELFARQEEGDLAVLAEDLANLDVRGAARRVYYGRGPQATVALREGALWWRGERLLEVAELRLRGGHNIENAMAAAAVCLERSLDPAAVRAGIASFPGVPHRLEEVARIGGVLYVNDSKATNVASTLVALRAFAGAGIHVILGGRGKGQDFGGLRDAVGGCRAVYLIGEAAGLIAAALEGVAAPVHDCGDLARALARARAAAAPGEVVLLSPGCASFDQFEDFEDRGERFRELVGEGGSSGS
ncbi:MAG TPA: UDP-N-acetylmuramoyl-L-alanine--D-glutamate ligase [Solirubrobacteraceae bacterium]|nr:UDP-N-acetylmuramoyl-L-alanine--D-glutamate ligase [Solirubrobacteraceae bacterium]